MPYPQHDSRSSAWPRLLVSIAGVLGASGIGLGAAGTHAGGGELARTAATFLLIHAVAIIAIAAYASRGGRPWLFHLSATVLALGVAAFAGDLATVAFTGAHIVRGLAPTGGILMIVGWLGAAVSALL